MLCQFLPYSKENQLYMYIYPNFFGFPSHLGHHRALSRISCAIQYVLSYLFYLSLYFYFSFMNQKKISQAIYILKNLTQLKKTVFKTQFCYLEKLIIAICFLISSVLLIIHGVCVGGRHEMPQRGYSILSMSKGMVR